MKLLIVKACPDVVTPSYGSSCAAGLDISSYGSHTIPSKSRMLIPTGLRIQWVEEDGLEKPDEYYLRLAPRSGLSVKNSIDIGAGVIDYDYRGDVKVLLINNSDKDFVINHGDRIAQAILEKCKKFNKIELVEQLTDTVRGEGGFGSTGISSQSTQPTNIVRESQITTEPTDNKKSKKTKKIKSKDI